MRLPGRVCLFALVASAAAFGQGFSFGLKGGVPLTNALDVLNHDRYFSNRAPYVIGPAVELRLFAGLSAEADLLYRRMEYKATTTGTSSVEERTTGQVWEVPLLVKYRTPGELLRPFLLAGVSYRRLARFEQRVFSQRFTGTVQEPPELRSRSSAGATVGGGLELSVPLVRVSAELRYTRWGSSSFRAALTGLATQLNQADLLLGILF
ncbi:MAG: PorT family protein [Bryobacterales bacterium]|nr:PorT family protein [Bryobacterales bacterium]